MEGQPREDTGRRWPSAHPGEASGGTGPATRGSQTSSLQDVRSTFLLFKAPIGGVCGPPSWLVHLLCGNTGIPPQGGQVQSEGECVLLQS